MKITGIIAEYNPFHYGHEYQLTEARRLTKADYLVVVMSGDFVQRGEPAVYDKYTRTRMALQGGADLVIEMPAAFATSSAEDFAGCGVALLSQLGVVNALCFGSECGDITLLQDTAKLLAGESREFSGALKSFLKQGFSFPDSRVKAMSSLGIQDTGRLMSSPNNILGIEYCKAILRSGSALEPVTITRKGQGYHASTLPEDQKIHSSATAIRSSLDCPGASSQLMAQVPGYVWPAIEQGTPLFPNDVTGLLNYAILTKLHEGADLSEYADMSEDLAARLTGLALAPKTFAERIHQLKTKQYTYTRISRALLHLTLGMKTAQIAAYRDAGYASYARILGFRKDTGPLLQSIKDRSSIPMITKTSGALRNIQLSRLSAAMLEQDMYCSHLYQSLVQMKYPNASIKNEYQAGFGLFGGIV